MPRDVVDLDTEPALPVRTVEMQPLTAAELDRAPGSRARHRSPRGRGTTAPRDRNPWACSTRADRSRTRPNRRIPSRPDPASRLPHACRAGIDTSPRSIICSITDSRSWSSRCRARSTASRTGRSRRTPSSSRVVQSRRRQRRGAVDHDVVELGVPGLRQHVDETGRHPTQPEQPTRRRAADDCVGQGQARAEATLFESHVVASESVHPSVHGFEESTFEQLGPTTAAHSALLSWASVTSPYWARACVSTADGTGGLMDGLHCDRDRGKPAHESYRSAAARLARQPSTRRSATRRCARIRTERPQRAHGPCTNRTDRLGRARPADRRRTNSNSSHRTDTVCARDRTVRLGPRRDASRRTSSPRHVRTGSSWTREPRAACQARLLDLG